MTDDTALDGLVGDWLTLADVAERLGVTVGKVKTLVADHELAAAAPGPGPRRVPARFLDGDQILRGLGGTLTVLADAGYADDEAIRWLFSGHDALDGTRPLDALADNRPTVVHRLAQMTAF